MIIAATVPAVVVGLPIRKYCPEIQENLFLISGCFIITGMLLIWTLKQPEGGKTTGTMTWADAMFIGCVQGLAILPGLSRSGTTIVAGLFRKLNREESAVFSFLLSIPVIAGGGALEAKGLFKGAPQDTGTIPNWLMLTGMTASCIVGIISLLWLLDWLKKGKLWYFAVWVFVMAPLTLVLALTTVETADGRRQTQAEINPDQSSLSKAIEETAPSDRLKMSREEAMKEYEKIVAEEEAAERAAIEEEKKRMPFVDEPEKLILIDPNDRIWITPDKKSVIVLGRIALREGLLEFFACCVGTKEHESVISMRVKPFMLHAALLAIGAEQGKPVQVMPKFIPPSGEEIEILVRWKDDKGEIKEALAQDWVLDEDATEKNGTNTAMKSNWVFSGSMIYQDGEGKNHYMADETGELFGLSNFVGAILDVPFESSADNDDLLFTCFTERIPELYTPVTLILTKVKSE